jgi:hypothetical protein
MSLVLQSSGGGLVTLQEPTTASNFTVTVPAETGTMITTASTFAGTGPAFSASRTTTQSLTSNTWTKFQGNVEEFDTNSCYDNSTNFRFTPNVAGYYEVNGRFGIQTADTRLICAIYKNGTEFRRGADSGSASFSGLNVSCLVYLNGSTDYIEYFVFSALTQNTVSLSSELYFSASMVRAA